MRFLKYLEITSDKKDDALFRALNIGLVEKSTPYKSVVKQKSKNALKLIEILNDELQKSYKGKKYQFDFVTENNISLDKIKIISSRKNFLKKLCLEFNDKLADIQSNYEKDLKKVDK